MHITRAKKPLGPRQDIKQLLRQVCKKLQRYKTSFICARIIDALKNKFVIDRLSRHMSDPAHRLLCNRQMCTFAFAIVKAFYVLGPGCQPPFDFLDQTFSAPFFTFFSPRLRIPVGKHASQCLVTFLRSDNDQTKETGEEAKPASLESTPGRIAQRSPHLAAVLYDRMDKRGFDTNRQDAATP
jgi:hypothetical protein